jgi:predicted aspartyl protease
VPLRVPLDGEPCVEAHLDDRTAPSLLVVDTGAIRTAVDKSMLRDVENGVGKVTIRFGNGVVLANYEVLAVDLSTARDHIGAPIMGLIGQDLVERYYFGLDYRNARAYVSEAPPSEPPPGFAATDSVNLPYELVQGLPIVTVRIGGKSARLLADTGSGVTLLVRSKVDPAALSKGLDGYFWHTSYGSDPATIIRVPSIEVGSREVKQTWAVVVPDDNHLAAVFKALKIEIDGFLGYPVYREFFVGVRGAEKRYELFPNAAVDPLSLTEWNRVGIELSRSAGSVLVDMVFSPSDASAKGVMRGDVITSVDGAAVASLDLDAIRHLLRGDVGSTRRLNVVRQGVEQAIDVRVDALLP